MVYGGTDGDAAHPAIARAQSRRRRFVWAVMALAKGAWHWPAPHRAARAWVN